LYHVRGPVATNDSSNALSRRPTVIQQFNVQGGGVRCGVRGVRCTVQYSVTKVHMCFDILMSIATKDPYDSVQRLDHLRYVCYKHINLRIVFGVMFTELILVYYLTEN
jgi:hypothetical protein